MPRGARPTIHGSLHSVVMRMVERDAATIAAWLREIRALHRRMRCRLCGRSMQLVKASDRIDGTVWHCRRCHSETSIRTASLFADSNRIPLSNWVKYMYLWSKNTPQKEAVEQGVGSKRVVSKLNKLLCNVASRSLMTTPLPQLNGDVSIDESVFTKRKYHRGRLRRVRWVFGLVSQADSLPIMVVVHQRDAATLLPLIVQHVRPGSTIHSDMWAAYRQLGGMGYNHFTVNHSRNFVNPVTGCHTNHIEGEWARAKRFLVHKKTSTHDDLQRWLNVYMWRRWRGERWLGGVFCRMLHEIQV